MEKLHNSTYLFYISIFSIGVISTFAIPPFSFLPLIFALGFGIYLISFIPSLKKIFFAGWILGFGWFSFGLYWIGLAFLVSDTYSIFLMPLSVVVLPCILSFFWGCAFLCAKLITQKNKSPILMIIIFLSLFEYLRAHLFTGFPWLMPSMVLTSNVYIIQVLSYIGSFTGNLIILTLSVLPSILFCNMKYKYFIFILLLVPTLMIFCFGGIRFNNKEIIPKSDNQLISLVQPNILQKDKWNLKKRKGHIKQLIKLSTEDSEKYKDKNRLIIWPETSFEGSIPNEISLLSNISQKILKNKKATLVVGLLSNQNEKLFNSLVFLNSDGKINYHYNKIHLVPFGEYIPFRSYLSIIAKFFSPRDFSRGSFKQNYYLKGFGEIIPLICYEILFSDEVYEKISEKTKLLINITNDAWFGKSVGPFQHLSLAKIRAVELGLPLARVANTGFSAFISPYGEEIIKIPLYVSGVQTVGLYPPLDDTLYKKYGELIFIISIIYILIINLIINAKKEEFNEK